MGYYSRISVFLKAYQQERASSVTQCNYRGSEYFRGLSISCCDYDTAWAAEPLSGSVQFLFLGCRQAIWVD